VLADGTPKSWLFFAAFYAQTQSFVADLGEGDAFVQKLREWRAAKPDSVPAWLALCNALTGECDWIWKTADQI
jgi:hypothetical protein